MTKAKTTHAEATEKVARSVPFVASDLVLTEFDNEAMEGDASVCACRVMMVDGSSGVGTAPRTDDLAADQAAAKAAAIGNL